MDTNKIIDILIVVVFFAALIPTIADNIVGAQGGNVTGAASTLLGLTTLFIVAAFVVYIYRHGLGKK